MSVPCSTCEEYYDDIRYDACPRCTERRWLREEAETIMCSICKKQAHRLAYAFYNGTKGWICPACFVATEAETR